jgi:hypothetical protein
MISDRFVFLSSLLIVKLFLDVDPEVSISFKQISYIQKWIGVNSLGNC